jgi:hypothetical protein
VPVDYIFTREASDTGTDVTGYPDNLKAGYRIFGWTSVKPDTGYPSDFLFKI